MHFSFQEHFTCLSVNIIVSKKVMWKSRLWSGSFKVWIDILSSINHRWLLLVCPCQKPANNKNAPWLTEKQGGAWKYFFLTMSFFSLLFSFNLNFSINHCFSSTPPQLSLPENSNSFNVFPFTIVFDRIIITSLKLNKHSNLQQFFHAQQLATHFERTQL